MLTDICFLVTQHRLLSALTMQGQGSTTSYQWKSRSLIDHVLIQCRWASQLCGKGRYHQEGLHVC